MYNILLMTKGTSSFDLFHCKLVDNLSFLIVKSTYLKVFYSKIINNAMLNHLKKIIATYS